MRVRGEYGFSSLVKQNKRAKIGFVIYIAARGGRRGFKVWAEVREKGGVWV